MYLNDMDITYCSKWTYMSAPIENDLLSITVCRERIYHRKSDNIEDLSTAMMLRIARLLKKQTHIIWLLILTDHIESASS